MSANTTTNTERGAKSSGHPLSGGMGLFLFLVLIAAAGWLTYRTLFVGMAEKAVGHSSMFVCSETNKAFPYTMKEGEDYPVTSPFSNKKTGYPSEACYWTKDGKQKETPTYVILNSLLGKSGDTMCPECGRPVIGHNPRPPASVPTVKK